MSILTLEYPVFVLLTVIVYYAMPLKCRWLVLTAASIAFYSFAGWESGAYLLTATCVAWGGALLTAQLSRSRKKAASAVTIGVTLLLLLGGMAFIKYADALRALFTGQASSLNLLVPLGLSWFTFQAAGYVIDVSRGTAEAERNPLKVLLFLGFFPQLTQGPVSTWKELAPQLSQGHRLEPAGVTEGFQLMLWGYFKKLVIADRLAMITAWVNANEAPGWLVLASPLIYMLQLYCDFSGGMDAIRGTAKLLGIELPQNFKRPFFALSVAEYWRRWHITLGVWFRSYLLYPFTTCRMGLALGRAGSRVFGKKTGRLIPAALATVLIFFLIGIWHGASLNAAIYGLYFGVLMAASTLLEPFFKGQRKKLGAKAKAWPMQCLRLVRTLALVAVPQFFAFSKGTAEALSLMARVPQAWDRPFVETMLQMMEPLEWWIALAGLLLLLAVDLLDERGFRTGSRLAGGTWLIRWPVLLFLVVAIVVFGCYGSGFNAAGFLYTQF